MMWREARTRWRAPQARRARQAWRAATLCAAVVGGPGAVEAEPGTGSTSPLLEDGGFFEIGVEVSAERSIRARESGEGGRDVETRAGLGVAGSWRRGPVFVEGTDYGLAGLSIGATLWHGERRTLDLLVAHLPSSIEQRYNIDQDPIDAASTERERDVAVLERNSLTGFSGLRFREYRGDWLAEGAAVISWNNGNGVLANARLGRQWQFGNWNVTALSGLGYGSAALLDHLYGVDAAEATERFTAYEAGDSVFAEADVSMSRAIGKRLVLRGNLSGWRVSDEMRASPLIVRSTQIELGGSLSYVF